MVTTKKSLHLPVSAGHSHVIYGAGKMHRFTYMYMICHSLSLPLSLSLGHGSLPAHLHNVHTTWPKRKMNEFFLCIWPMWNYITSAYKRDSPPLAFAT